MASNAYSNVVGDQARSMPFLDMGDGMIALQRETLGACQQWNREWLSYMQSEMDLWADLARKVATAGSVPQAMDAYAKTLSQQMQMTAEQGQHLFNDYQKISHKVTKSAATPVAQRQRGDIIQSARRQKLIERGCSYAGRELRRVEGLKITEVWAIERRVREELAAVEGDETT